jgi:hypothetical protein
MFVRLTHSKHLTALLVNLERVIYAYRDERHECTVLVFGQVPRPDGGVRNVAVTVSETLNEIQEKRRMSA